MLEKLDNELDEGDIWLFCHDMKDRRKVPRIKPAVIDGQTAYVVAPLLELVECR